MRPLRDALTSSDDLFAFLAELGWALPSEDACDEILPVLEGLAASFDQLSAATGTLREGQSEGETNDVLAGLADDLTEAIQTTVQAVHALENVDRTSLGSPFDQEAFWRSTSDGLGFPEGALSLLAYTYLRDRVPPLFGVLRALGILTETSRTPSTPGRVPYVEKAVRLDRVVPSLTDLGSVLRDVHGWGTASFDHAQLLAAAADLFRSFGLEAGRYAAQYLDDYYDPGSAYRSDVPEVRANLFWTLIDAGAFTGRADIALIIIPVPPIGDPTAAPDGLAIFPSITGTVGSSLSLTDSVVLTLSGGYASTPARVEIHPAGLSVTEATSGLEDEMRIDAHPAAPWVLLGDADGTGLQLGRAHAAIRATGPVDSVAFQVEAAADEMSLVLDMSEADGFMRTVLGGARTEFDLAGGVAWSSLSGLSFFGQGPSLEACLPLNVTIAEVVEIDSLCISLRASSADSAVLTLAVDGSLTLGPVAMSVEGIGLSLTVAVAADGEPKGNLGYVDLTFGFKPPDGLGLVIDAGVVTGGGYLFFDSEDGEYAGVAELSVQDVFSLTVIGLVTTQLPDGSEGYSFLFIVAVEFQPIQLGFGFTLNGVGGLAGVNRTMLTDVLAAGIRDHTLDSILFPEDPVANAPQIISDLESVFPVDEGRYVFGPMLEIGWGTPSLVTAELGVFIELPDPVRIVIIGQIAALLPSADAPLVEIHLDSVGVIDFEAGTLAIDASLYDSKILTFALSGDMALRAETGSDPSFALSVGGLNPHFDPPAGFPELRRLTLSLGSGDNPRLSCESYLALTSNTVQFGSAIDAYAEAAGFAVSGHLGFDVLFVLSPFSFIADMDADVALLKGETELMSVALDVSLSGPTPWHADGKATAKVCGFKVSVSFDETWGSSEDATLPSGDARTPLLAALADTRSWTAALPADTEAGATIGSLAASEGAILVHSLGTLSVRQTVAPLNVTIERFGSTTPGDWDRFEISEVALGEVSAATSTVEDDFAPAQFFEMSDSEKLSSPSYEAMDAGVSIGSDDAVGGHTATLEVEYEEYIVDDRALPARMLGLYKMPASVFGSLLRQGAGELSLVRSTGAKKYVTVGTASPIATESVRHVVSSTSDLSIRTDIMASGTSRSAANAALEEYLALHPAEREGLQVVPAFEAAA